MDINESVAKRRESTQERRTLRSDSTTERKGWVLISLSFGHSFGQLDRKGDTYFPAAHAMKVRVVVTDFLL